VPAERCEIDHIIPWPLGGATSQANGTCRCGGHNREREPEHIRRRRRPGRKRGTGRDDPEPAPDD
jgi:hypothetical protein